jgi:hypothetical protein
MYNLGWKIVRIRSRIQDPGKIIQDPQHCIHIFYSNNFFSLDFHYTQLSYFKKIFFFKFIVLNLFRHWIEYLVRLYLNKFSCSLSDCRKEFCSSAFSYLLYFHAHLSGYEGIFLPLFTVNVWRNLGISLHAVWRNLSRLFSRCMEESPAQAFLGNQKEPKINRVSFLYFGPICQVL